MVVISISWKAKMTLAEFIESEIKKRDMSIREFSRMAGLSHSTVSQYLNEPDSRKVSIEFLVKISVATNTDLSSIVAMVYPELTSIDPESRIMAEQIRKLPQDKRGMLGSLLVGIGVQFNQENDGNS